MIYSLKIYPISHHVRYSNWHDNSIHYVVVGRCIEYTGDAVILFDVQTTGTQKTAECVQLGLPKLGFNFKGNVFTSVYVSTIYS